MNAVQLTGQKIGRWLVISQAPSEKGISRWHCLCDCGTERVVARGVLREKVNVVKSCGCWRSDRITAANTKHGHVNTPTYRSWSSMMTRCNNKNFAQFKYWGGRGIKVCERWNDFANFLADMGERPAGKTLDRFPNNETGHYEPGNCRWATPKEQVNNRRKINGSQL